MELEDIQLVGGSWPMIDRDTVERRLGGETLTFNVPNCHFVKLQCCIFHKITYCRNSWITFCSTYSSIMANKHCRSRDQGPIMQLENSKIMKKTLWISCYGLFLLKYTVTQLLETDSLFHSFKWLILIAFKCFFIYFLIIRL